MSGGMVRGHGFGFGGQGIDAGCTALLGCSAGTCGLGCAAVEALCSSCCDCLNGSLDDEEACTAANLCAAAVIRLDAARDARATSDAWA